MGTYAVIVEELGVEDSVRHTVTLHAENHADAAARVHALLHRPVPVVALAAAFGVVLVLAGEMIWQWAWSLK